MKKILLVISFIITSWLIFAQEVFIPHIHLFTDTATENSISITGMDIEAKITANIAVTTYDIVFYNDSNRNLEGQFEFPLKQGQSVCGFALDINGKMRDGVIVEKEKGRQVFEQVVRTQIDPALLEVTAGNNFKARIYPIPKQGSRHIRIKIQEKLSDSKYVLDPLTDKVIRRFNFKLLDYRNSVDNSIIDSNVIDLSTGVAATFEKTDFEWTKPVVVQLAKSKTDNDVFIETTGTNSFFFAPLKIENKLQPKGKINVLGVYFDSSLSRRNSNLDKELELLKAYIEKQGKGTVEIINFSNTVKGSQLFKYNQWQAIENYIRSFSYDGATNLNNLDFKTSRKYDEVLLFTDGINNWGKEEESLKMNCPLNTVNTSYSGNFNFLEKTARNNNGVFINLAKSSVEQGLMQLTTEPLRLLSITADKGISEVYPAPGTVVNDDFSVAGILTSKTGNLVLKFGYGKEVAFEKNISLSSVTGFESENVARLWAQKKIDELSLDYKKNKNEILEVSRKYTIITEGTSLIVLENVRDYIRYKITPPSELLEEYNKITAANFKPAQKEGIPESVYRCFEAFKKWWETTPEEFRKQFDQKNQRTQNGNDWAGTAYNGSASTRASAATERLYLTEDAVVYNDMAMEAAAAPEGPARLERRAMAKSSTDSSANNQNVPKNPEVKIQPWNPNADYLKQLKKVETKEMYNTYLKIRDEYISSPSFYMDVASYFYKEGLVKEALRIISNLSELNLENTDMLRALGNKLMEFDCYDLASQIFENLCVIRSEVPQFLRDSAKAYEQLGEYQKACDLLYSAASKNWDVRYSEIQQVCLNDMNSIISRNPGKVDVSKYDKQLLENFPVDIRIVLTWNTDNCDIDLWVTDPDGEKCYYAHNRTRNGARLSRDFTQGYGPEEFCLREAPEGKYKIQAHYYGAHQQTVLQPVTVQAEVYTNFGKSNQKCELLTLELKNVDGDYTIGEISF